MFGFISTAKLIALHAQIAAQSTTIEWLRHDVNRLNRENALLKSEKLGSPLLEIPFIDRADPQILEQHEQRQAREAAADHPSLEDLTTGNINFEDMGDDEAVRHGIDYDPATGGVRYRN